MRYLLSFFLLAYVHCAPSLGQEPPKEVADARTYVEPIGKAILLYAHPTATFKSLQFRRFSLDNDNAVKVVFSLNYVSAADLDNTLELVVTMDSKGVKSLNWGTDTGLIPPGFAANLLLSILAEKADTGDRQLKKLELDRNWFAFLKCDYRGHRKSVVEGDEIVDTVIQIMPGKSLEGQHPSHYKSLSSKLWLFTEISYTDKNTKNVNFKFQHAFYGSYRIYLDPVGAYIWFKGAIEQEYKNDLANRNWQKEENFRPTLVVFRIPLPKTALVDGKVIRRIDEIKVKAEYLSFRLDKNGDPILRQVNPLLLHPRIGWLHAGEKLELYESYVLLRGEKGERSIGRLNPPPGYEED